MDRFDAEDRWPECFEGLSDLQRTSVLDALVAGWHAGWNPTRADVQNLCDFTRGEIDMEEYRRRAVAAAEHDPADGSVRPPSPPCSPSPRLGDGTPHLGHGCPGHRSHRLGHGRPAH